MDKSELYSKEVAIEYGTWFVVRDEANVIAFVKYDEDATDMALKYLRTAIESAALYHRGPDRGERLTKLIIEARYYPDLTAEKEKLDVQ